MNGDLVDYQRLYDLNRDFSNKELDSENVIILPPHVYLQIVAKGLVIHLYFNWSSRHRRKGRFRDWRKVSQKCCLTSVASMFF